MTSARGVVVTGAAGVMGSAIVRRLVARGFRVFATDLSGRRLAELERLVAADLEAGPAGTGALVGSVKADATVRTEVERVVAAADTALEGIDGLVNVVGGYRGELYTSVLEIDDVRFDSAVDMTLRSVLLMTQLCGRGMVDRGYGRIVNIGSIAMNGAEGQADYAGLKAAVVGFTRTCAMELAPAVTVNAVVPGVIDTSVMARMTEEMQTRYRDRIPLGRWGAPDEVAAAVAFLISDEASYITGEDLYVSGGFRSWL